MIILFNKKALLYGGALLLGIIILVSLVFSFLIKGKEDNSLSVVTTTAGSIAIDPGHGGIDSGSYYEDLAEKEINLKIATKLRQVMLDKGDKVKLTRQKDISLDHLSNKYQSRHRRDLQARIDIIEREAPDFFLSLHVNYFDGPTPLRGPICFYQQDRQASKELARKIQAELNKINYEDVYLPNNEIRQGDYFILNNCEVPGVIIELGFLNKKIDRELLTEDEFQTKLAHGIYQGLLNYWQEESSSKPTSTSFVSSLSWAEN